MSPSRIGIRASSFTVGLVAIALLGAVGVDAGSERISRNHHRVALNTVALSPAREASLSWPAGSRAAASRSSWATEQSVTDATARAGWKKPSGSSRKIRIDGPIKGEVAYDRTLGRYDLYRVRLQGGGETATGKLLRPRQGEGPFPAVLVNDGRELNSAALEYLLPEFGDVVVLSLDYPDALPYDLDPLTMLLQSDRMRRELRRIPRLFSLGGAYLTQRADVDSSRVAMVVTSFAVPFGVRAAAEDERFRNVGLIYGAGELGTVLKANLTVKPRFLRSVAAWLASQLYDEFEPTHYIAGIAPRTVIMVNGRDDRQMPVRAVQALYDAAREPKTLIWLTTGHLLPTNTPLIRALVDTTLTRLPVLRSPPPEGSRSMIPPITTPLGGRACARACLSHKSR